MSNELMTAKRAIEMTHEIGTSDTGPEFIDRIIPFAPPEDSMLLYATFMIRAMKDAERTGKLIGSKPMTCAMHVMRASDYVEAVQKYGLPPQQVTQLVDRLGRAPGEKAFRKVIRDYPDTLHPSVDFALAKASVESLLKVELDKVSVLEYMRQRLASQRWQ